MVAKKPQAYRTIGEASDTVGVPAHVLRFWETRFSQIRPMKKGGGRRYYRPQDISLLCGIKEYLYNREFSIKALQALLRTDGPDALIKIGKKQQPVAKVISAEAKETAPTKPAAKAPIAPAKTPDELPTDQSQTRQEVLQNALSSLQNAREKLSYTLKNN